MNFRIPYLRPRRIKDESVYSGMTSPPARTDWCKQLDSKMAFRKAFKLLGSCILLSASPNHDDNMNILLRLCSS